MAYPLNTFNGAQAAPAARPGVGRFAQEVFLVLGLALLIFMVMALASYSPQDGAWSTSGAGGPPHNWAGKLGAWLADLAYMLLGFSAWWCVAAVIRVWWGGVWRWMHGGAPVAAVAGDSVWSRLVSTRAAFWVGLALLLVASTGLEWSRLYRWDDALPGSAGGIVGAVGGPLAVHWLGFTGSALLGIAVLVLGMALVFRFSWSRVAERIGAGLYALLARVMPSPVVELNRAVAVGKAFGADAGLAIADALRDVPPLRGYAPLHAVLGDLLQQIGRTDEARVEFSRAAELTGNAREREVLAARAVACG